MAQMVAPVPGRRLFEQARKPGTLPWYELDEPGRLAWADGERRATAAINHLATPPLLAARIGLLKLARAGLMLAERAVCSRTR